MSWQAIVSSAIGTKHLKGGKPCQDYGAYEIISDGQLIIGAVSDGMGSVKHSEVGSQLAVQVAISELKFQIGQFQPTNEEQGKNFFGNVVEEVRAALKEEADTKSYLVEELACTLLIFVATPEWLAAMQIGDGLIVVRPEDGDYQLLFKPDKGEFANETTSVTAADALQQMQVCFRSIPHKFICAATDGIENISLSKPEGWKPSGNFFSPLENCFFLKNYFDLQQELDCFLNSEKINKRTDDDKTLLLCVYHEFLISEINSQQQGILEATNPSEAKAKTKQINQLLLKSNIPIIQPSSRQEEVNRDVKSLECQIFNVLNDLEDESTRLRKAHIKRIKNGYLEIWLESEEPLRQKEFLVRAISNTVVSWNKTPIRTVKIVNHYENITYWLEEFELSPFSEKGIIKFSFFRLLRKITNFIF